MLMLEHPETKEKVRALVTPLVEAMGTFQIQYVKKVKTKEGIVDHHVTLPCRIKATEMRMLEEKLKMGPRDIISTAGVNMACLIIYVGHFHKAAKGWNPMEADAHFDAFVDAGGGYSDICEPVIRLYMRTMPELRRFLEERGMFLDKKPDEKKEGDVKEDPTSSTPTVPAEG
jgi:hypothetical protein